MLNTISLSVIRADIMIVLDVFVRLRDLDFIRLNLYMHSVWILKWYRCPSIFSLSSLGDDPLYARVTPTFAPMITYATFFVSMK